jgi:hypothetical protein
MEADTLRTFQGGKMPDPDLNIEQIFKVALDRSRDRDLPLKVRTAYHELHAAALQLDLCVKMEETMGAIRKWKTN